MKKKTTQLKQLIQSQSLSYLMEAHNGLSARIVEETGFKGIWASGLSISASLGVRDNNEASWTQVVDVLEFMSDATTIPILLDGDTGYGNFNNLRRLVKKLEQRNIAGVCIEDKCFPKKNSFINGESQELANCDEFCGKIKAAKDTQMDSDFCVVARIEAFIAGLGLEEALKRATAYSEAGADAILVHSKKSTADDITQFMKHWTLNTPIVIVPTKYYATPTELFETIGISTIIWANHSIRSSVNAIQQTTQTIYNDHHLKNVENTIVPVKELFRLQGADELADAETQYLPGYNKSISSIILAAGPSKLGDLTKNAPKSLLKVKGKTILDHQVLALKKYNISQITVARGHNKEAIKANGFNIVDNNDFDNSYEVYSLFLAKEALNTGCIISYGDILYKDYFIHECLNSTHDISIVVDATSTEVLPNKDLVTTSGAYNAVQFDQHETLVHMDRDLKNNPIHGEFVGVINCSKSGSEQLKKVLESYDEATLKKMRIQDVLNVLDIPVHIIYVQGGWVDVNTMADLHLANNFYD